MAKVRSRYWIPRLRQLVRKVRGACHGCKRFQALAYAAPPPGNLPTTRTHGTNPYQVIGVDYAGPIRYRVSKQREEKAYVLLYACSLTRGIYLDLLPNLETAECLRSLKKFIAHRGRPERIYSDNGRTFVGAAEWMKTVMKDERLQTYLSTNQIKWQFNLSRAPWWGGQFERLIGLVKTALNKTIGNGMLRWEELQEVLLDVEINLNSRPLSYVEDDVQLPLLTPNSMLFLNSNVLPELLGKELVPVKVVKDLGIILDSNLTYNEHIITTVSACMKRLGQINRVKHAFDQRTLTIIINSLVFSKLFYCSNVWSNTTERNLDKLQAVQNFACRIISGARKFDHITPILKRLQWLPVRDQLYYRQAIMCFKCMTGSAPGYLTE